MRRILLAVSMLVTAITFVALNDDGQTASADAVGQVTDTISTSVTCPPFNLFNPDAGPTVNGRIICSTGYRAVRIESENAGAYYVCGKTGCTRTNYTTVGFKRCPTCTYGGAFTIDADLAAGVRCISGTADGGITLPAFCGK